MAEANDVRVGLALAVGLAGMLLALGIVLSRSPPIVAGGNRLPARFGVTFLHHGGKLGCQRAGTLPRGTDAIRVSLSANAGPKVSAQVLTGSHVISEGERPAGWGATETVTVPVRRVAQTTTDATVCVTLGAVSEPIQVNGAISTAGGRQAIRLRMEYLRPGPSSWFSLIASVARRMGLARAPSGDWIAYLVIALMIAAAAIAIGLVLRAARSPGAIGAPMRASVGRRGARLRAVPAAAWACALVAVLSAVCWSLVTPPFQVPDEPSHFAYTQLLAEAGRLPVPGQAGVFPEEEAALEGLHQQQVQWHPEVQTISTPAELAELRRDLSLRLSAVGSESGAGVAASEPPGYYALETIPYYLGAGGTLLERLQLMRLLSALMAGITALFTFLFIREALPGAPWAWTVGGLAAALTPLLGFTSGGVTPDAMLFAVSAAVFYCLARAFRRGLTLKLGLALGALTALGLLTKLNFIGLAPGIVLGLLVLGIRRARARALACAPEAARRRRPPRVLALVLALALSPVLVYVLSNLLQHRATLGLASNTLHDLDGQSPLDALTYAWQLYLPRLPGMHAYFPGVSTIRQLWFARAVGDYGWFDTAMPVWVQNLALIPAGAIAILATRGAIAHRATLRARLPELLTYLALTIGLLALIGLYAYNSRAVEGAAYFQPRYLLPLLPLGAALLALAARGAGRRWGPAAGALIVMLFLAHDVFSQLQVVARYYG
ncbi:MAG TPA: DUF2142 domain-containing protein [Solirubrobacteraceae bacterium]|jgi:hypothetical protein|nr:DUF2142 domain-containing protein [Solirubrobacteraceae bacterium]